MDIINSLRQTVIQLQEKKALQAQPLQELSKKTLGSYIHKANDQYHKADEKYHTSKSGSNTEKQAKKIIIKRGEGIDRALEKKSKKIGEELDESHDEAEKTLKDYKKHKRLGIPHPKLGRVPRGADISHVENERNKHVYVSVDSLKPRLPSKNK
jgi:hypothetical protein